MNGISLRVFNKQVVKYIFFIIRTCILSQIYILIIQYIYKITQNNTLLNPNNTISGLEIRAWLFMALFALSHSFLRALLNFLGADILPYCLNISGCFPNFWGQ